VILVLNGERINRTLRAIIKGLKLFDSQVISGVVLSNVAPRQAEKLVKSLPDEGIEVLWIMPMSKAVADAFSYRYLGLVPVGER
jgi:cobyrinic acid a,c-diamide synthase